MTRRTRTVVVGALLLLSVVPYARVVRFDFVGLDDRSYLTRNPVVREGLSAEGWTWAWTTGHMANWHPVTWLSHMLDVELYGLDAGGHHATNAAIHLTNSALLYALLHRATGAVWRPAFAAALFAAHPLRVESVAWVAQRKDVLSVLFGLLAFHVYLGFARRGGGLRLAGATLLLGLGLASKPTLVTFPLLCLLLDAWPLRRWGREPLSRLLLEKLPFFVLALESSLVTLLAQRGGGALPTLMELPLAERLGNAVVSYTRYLGMTLAPVGLSPYYLHPRSPGGTPLDPVHVMAAGALLAAISVLVLRARARPYLAVGWLWYAVALIPMIGLVQVGSQALADRYTYLPSIGLAFALTWGVADLGRRIGTRTAIRARALAAVAVGAWLACLGLTWLQVGHWRNSTSLYENALRQHRGNPLILNNLGEEYRRQGRTDEAAERFREAIAIDPKHAKAYNNLGLVLHASGRLTEALELFGTARELDPGDPAIHSNLGMALQSAGRLPEALEAYREAIRLAPDHAQVHNNLGVALERLGEQEAAFEAFQRAVALDSHYADGHYNLGRALERRGEMDAALDAYRAALAREPSHAPAHLRLGAALKRMGRPDEAYTHLRRALEARPDFVAALAHGADLLLARPELDPDGLARARAWAERAAELTRRSHVGVLRLLAAVQAGQGEYASAIETAQEALGAAEATGDAQQAATIRSELAAYRSGRPRSALPESAPRAGMP